MSEQYVFTDGNYAEYRGYVFANGKPVTILDNGTLVAIAKEKNFRKFVPNPDPVPEVVATSENSCHKCGNIFERGLTMHVRFCRGKD